MLLSIGEMTPPTQWVTPVIVGVSGGNRVPNHDSLGIHEHLSHEQAHDSLSFLGRAGFGAIPKAPKKRLEALRQRNICFLIEGFGFQCIEL